MALAAVGVVVIVLAGVVLRIREPASSAPAGASIARFAASPVPDDRVAPDLTLHGLGGGRVALDELGDRVVVVNFWASWCDPCRDEAPGLERVWRAFRGRGVAFIGVDHEDERGPALAFARSAGMTYPLAFDPEGTTARAFRAAGIPSTYVVDRGRIVYRFLGRVEPETLSDILDATLARRGGT